MDLIMEVRKLLGSAPEGYEFLEYLVCAVVLLLLINSCIGLLSAVFKWVGGQR